MRKYLLLTICFALLSNNTFTQNKVQEIIKSRVESSSEKSPIIADGIVLNSQSFLSDFYKSNDYNTAWDKKRNATELLLSLQLSYDDGLIPEDYHMERLKKLINETNKTSSAEKYADLDMIMTDAFILYASHLIVGKVEQSMLRSEWDISPNTIPVEAAELLIKVLDNNDLAAAINRVRPQTFMYKHLKNGLKQYRELSKNGGWPSIPDGEVLKPGMNDDRLDVIKEYLILTGDLNSKDIASQGNTYDEVMVEAVKKFQFRHNLNQDGVIGKGTLAVMNVPIEQRIDEIRINLERSRWVVHHLPEDFLIVNIAGYNVRRITNDSTVYYSRVIVGKHYHETPIFIGKMRYIELNPTWTLPYSIATKETLPKLQKDPSYLTKKNIIIMDRGGSELDPMSIDFNALSSGNFPYTLRQKAGPSNALGEVKFMFPNKYAVYLHDTPSRSLFGREERAFSHGCIRLDKKWELLISLMDDPDIWNMEKINSIVKSEVTTRVNLKQPIDILILYWTAGADIHDNLYFNKDVYERDPEVLEALNRPIKLKIVN